MAEPDFYRQQAELQREEASASSLTHARERHERAASAWTAMAERAERGERSRAERGS